MRVAITILFLATALVGCGEGSPSTQSSQGSESAVPSLEDRIDEIARKDLGEPYYPDDKGYASTTCSGSSCTVTYQGQTHNTAMHPEEDFVTEGNYGAMLDMFEGTDVTRLTLVAKYEPKISMRQTCTPEQFARLHDDDTYRQMKRSCRASYRGVYFGG